MQFLADMGVSLQVVEWLRAAGHDAVHLREQDTATAAQRRHFQKAHAEGRIVLTFDLDFGEIVAGSAGKVVSVILFRLRNTRSAFIITRLAVALQQSSVELQSGAVVVVEDGRHRVRKLPLGS